MTEALLAPARLARLLQQADLRRRWSEGGAELLAAALEPGRDEPAAQGVVVRSRALADASVALLLLARGQDRLQVVAAAGDGTASALVDQVVPVAGTLCGQVLLDGEAIAVDEAPEGTGLRADLSSGGVVEPGPALLVPVGAATGTGGVLALVRPCGARAFGQLELELASAFGRQAALVLGRTRTTADSTQSAVLEDRDRIARDLHDLVIQRVFATGLNLQGLARGADGPLRVRLERAVDDLDQTMRDIRATVFRLHRRPDSAELRGQIIDVVDEAERPLGFRPALDLHGPISQAVSDEIALHLLAVLREALSNVARHARARSVVVTVTAGGELALVVEDDGVGPTANPAGSGTRNMRARATLFGGSSEISARPGGGTRLRWTVPCSD